MSENDENFGNDFENREPKKKADRTINIVHTLKKKTDKELDDSFFNSPEEEIRTLKKERDDYAQIVQLQAEKAFEEEKDAVVAQFPESEQEKISDLISDDPDKLEQVKTQLALNPPVIRQTSSRPRGKASIPSQRDNAEYDVQDGNEYHEIVDDLYKTAKFDPNPMNREKANDQIDALFNEYEKGMFEHRHENVKFTATQCLRCGSILSGVDAERYVAGKGCSVCGYKSGVVRKPKHLERY